MAGAAAAREERISANMPILAKPGTLVIVFQTCSGTYRGQVSPGRVERAGLTPPVKSVSIEAHTRGGNSMKRGSQVMAALATILVFSATAAAQEKGYPITVIPPGKGP